MRESIMLAVKRIDKELPLPRYAYEGDAGLDLFSAIDLIIDPFQRVMIPTGLAIAIPDGYAGFVQPRSGLALKAGMTIVNTPGLVDASYRGELKVIALNIDSKAPICIRRGDRIAQLVIQRVPIVELIECEELDETERGEQGFGSSLGNDALR